jgi:shikimate dehydrogenase
MKHPSFLKPLMKQFYVIGNPISHSKSPIIHQNFAEQMGITLSYEQFLSEIPDFESTISRFVKTGISGVNVTLPFKERAFALCDEATSRAKLSRAVNTLSFIDGKIYGDNTDGAGLVSDFSFNQVSLLNKKILVIGAGGATRGAIPAILDANPTSITIVNRTFEKAQLIVDELDHEGLDAEHINNLSDQYDVIINATSSSVTNDLPVINPLVFNKATCIYDLFYKQERTRFLSWALEQNPKLVVIDGLGMLIEQAAEAFYVWHKQRPDTSEIRKILKLS